MKFKGKGVWKKITALVATGILMTSNKSTINAQIMDPVKNVREVDVNDDLLGDPIYDNDNLVKKIKDFQTNTSKTSEDLVVKVLKGLLEGQFETNSVLINNEFNEHISGIIIDGRNIVVEFKGGEKVQGEAERLELNGLVLEKLYIYDTECMNDYVNMSYSDLKEKYKNREQLYIEINNTSVTKEFKACDRYFPDVFCSYDFDEEYLNLNNCENIWLDDFDWSDINKYINSWNSAQNIILTDLYVDDEYEDNIIIENNSLKNIIIEPLISISNIDLSGCDKLECLIGIGSIEQIKGSEKANILNYSRISLDNEICAFSTEEKIQQYIIKDLKQAKDLIENQFKTQEIQIDGRYNHYISGIKIDGRNVEVEFCDGKKMNGECSTGKLLDIELEYLSIYDSKFINNSYIESNDLDLVLSKVTVSHELKLSPLGNINVFVDFEDSIDISKCKKIWLNYIVIDDSDIRAFNNDTELEKLILTNINGALVSNDNVLRLENNNLQTFIINAYSVSNEFADFDLNGCEKLSIFSGGTHFGTTNLDGIKECKKLKKLGLGALVDRSSISDIVYLSFEEKEDQIIKGYDTSNPSVGYNNNNFISDMTAIKNNPSIEVIDISFVEFVTSDHFLEVIKTLPNLKKIVGNEINQVTMFSEELVEYCNKAGIEHPFTDKTLELKNYIRNIIDSIITPEMSDLDKIKEISKYVMENMEYDDEVAEKSDSELTPEDIINTWGENIWYNFFHGKGVCEGYTEVVQNLMLEAGVDVFNCNIPSHTYNLVKVGETYYEIDLTSLDWYIEVMGYSYDNYPYDIDSIYYMEPVGEKLKLNVWSYMEPLDSNKQREDGYSRILDFDDFMYKNPNSNKNTHTPKKAENIMKLIGILAALGIATKILREKAINRNVTSTWDTEELKKLCQRSEDKENDSR